MVREACLCSEVHRFESPTSRIYVGGKSEGNCLPTCIPPLTPIAPMELLTVAVLGSFQVCVCNYATMIRVSLKKRVHS